MLARDLTQVVIAIGAKEVDPLHVVGDLNVNRRRQGGCHFRRHREIGVIHGAIHNIVDRHRSHEFQGNAHRYWSGKREELRIVRGRLGEVLWRSRALWIENHISHYKGIY